MTAPDLTPPLRVGVDVIGVHFDPAPLPEGWTPGDPQPPPIARPGWHVNVKGRHLALYPALAAHVVEPDGTPIRRFEAGVTVRLWFVDAQAAADAAPALRLDMTDGQLAPALPVVEVEA